MKIRQNIPNFLTCCNLLCGCLAIVCAFEGNLIWSAYLVGIAAVFDFFDGFAARLLKVSSPIGKDLDSLADMVTFGVVPGIVMFTLIKNAVKVNLQEAYFDGNYPGYYDYIAYFGFLIIIFSAIRLAKFNNDTRQTESFIGLPTPANAILICSIPLIIKQIIWKHSSANPLEILADFSKDPLFLFLNNHLILLTASCLLSFLLVAPLPLFALKFKSFGWKGNEIRYIFLALSLILIITLKFLGIPLIIILYIFLSIIHNLIKKPQPPSPHKEEGLSPEGDFKV